MYKEVIGYDIRLCIESYIKKSWLNERRNEYLLRPEIAWPLSVDTTVWPSVFSYAKAPEYIGQIAVKPQNPRQDALNLWADLEKMVGRFEEFESETPGIIIGIEVISEEPLKSEECWGAVMSPDVSPLECPKNLAPVGYDVVSWDMFSGLSNCSYSEEEKASLIKYWPERLNDFGLIQKLEDALEFKKITEGRVPEHKPFYVHSILMDSSGRLG